MTPRSRAERRPLRVTITDGRGRTVRAPGLAAWLTRIAPKTAIGAIGVALVTDARISALNRQFRRKDAVTDVLSFPAGAQLRQVPADVRELGDIVIATGVARRQARDAGPCLQR